MRIFGRRDSGRLATYAAVLDGAHLWVDVDPDARVSLRETSSRDARPAGPAPYDLSTLTGDRYDVLVDGGHVLLASLPDRGPGRTPLAPDGVTQWDLTLDGEHLQLVRRTVAATAELGAIDLRGDRVHLRVEPPTVPGGCHLVLLDSDDELLASLPVTAHEGHVEALIGVDDLPAGHFGMIRLAVGTEHDWLRIRRRSNALADPNHGALLPELFDDRGTEQPRARFRWSPDGLLVLRSLDPAAAATGSAVVPLNPGVAS